MGYLVGYGVFLGEDNRDYCDLTSGVGFFGRGKNWWNEFMDIAEDVVTHKYVI